MQIKLTEDMLKGAPYNGILYPKGTVLTVKRAKNLPPTSSIVYWASPKRGEKNEEILSWARNYGLAVYEGNYEWVKKK